MAPTYAVKSSEERSCSSVAIPKLQQNIIRQSMKSWPPIVNWMILLSSHKYFPSSVLDTFIPIHWSPLCRRKLSRFFSCNFYRSPFAKSSSFTSLLLIPCPPLTPSLLFITNPSQWTVALDLGTEKLMTTHITSHGDSTCVFITWIPPFWSLFSWHVSQAGPLTSLGPLSSSYSPISYVCPSMVRCNSVAGTNQSVLLFWNAVGDYFPARDSSAHLLYSELWCSTTTDHHQISNTSSSPLLNHLKKSVKRKYGIHDGPKDRPQQDNSPGNNVWHVNSFKDVVRFLDVHSSLEQKLE